MSPRKPLNPAAAGSGLPPFPMHYKHRYPNPSGRNPFTAGGMLASSVAAGAMFTVWNRARVHQQDPFKKYTVLAIGSALVGVAQEVFRGGLLPRITR
jgi:hypothetical protein